MALADRYDLVEPLGEGSFGQVFRALDRFSGRTVAIKVLHRQDDDARRRFHREAVVLHSQLANEFVVALLDHSGLKDEDPYLVLEYCEFGSLRSWVNAGRGAREISTALLHAARGLAGVHAAGGLHRDIKPENLLAASVARGTGLTIKLADFGLAGFPHPVTGTMTLNACGTQGYIAPELYVGAPFHQGADVYSLGVVGIELLVGRLDLAGLDACDAPLALKALLRSMVAVLPRSRPTADDVVQRLSAILAPQPNVAPPSSSNLGESLAKGVFAIGVGIMAYAALSAFFGGSGTYYDASVSRNRGPDGRFREF